MSDSIKDFESAIAELEKIASELESGDLSLDASMQLYERGVTLARYCQEQLTSAERRIEQLTERGEIRDASHLADDER